MEQNMKETVNQINMNWQWTKIKAMQDINIGDYIFLARDNVKKIKRTVGYTALVNYTFTLLLL